MIFRLPPFGWAPCRSASACSLLRYLSCRSGCCPAAAAASAAAGPDRRRQRHDPAERVAIMSAIVVPTIIAPSRFAWWFRASNTRARYRPDFVYSGRIEMIVWSIPILVIMFLGGVIWIGSHELDPYKPLALADQADRGAGRFARLEMAVHLPGRRASPASTQLVVPAGRAGAFLADLGERDERVLHPAARQHDLHDERHGDAALPAGRPSRRFLRRCRRNSAATAFPACISRCMRCRRRISRNGSPSARAGRAGAGSRRLRRAAAGRARTSSRSPTARRAGAVRRHRDAAICRRAPVRRTAAADRGAADRRR